MGPVMDQGVLNTALGRHRVLALQGLVLVA